VAVAKLEGVMLLALLAVSGFYWGVMFDLLLELG